MAWSMVAENTSQEQSWLHITYIQKDCALKKTKQTRSRSTEQWLMNAADIWNIPLLDHLHKDIKSGNWNSYTTCTQTSIQRAEDHRKYLFCTHILPKPFIELFFVNPWFGGGSHHFIEFMDSKTGWKEKNSLTCNFVFPSLFPTSSLSISSPPT